MFQNNNKANRCESGSDKVFWAYSGKKKSSVLSLKNIFCRSRGSITLEAALSIPLFLFFVVSLISFLVILNVQTAVQNAIDEASRSLGKKAYIIMQAVNEPEGDLASGTGIDTETKSLMSAGINPSTIKLLLISDSNLRNTIENSRVISKTAGLYTYESSFDEENGILDIVVSYDYSIPWLPSVLNPVRLVQRSRSHVWTGDSLKKLPGADSSENHTVYITPTGSVYHLSPDCHYLDLSIHSISSSELGNARNKSGGRYDRCEECSRQGTPDVVYITDYGTSWHSSLGCSGLKRTVIETDIEDVGDMRACSKCSHEH